MSGYSSRRLSPPPSRRYGDPRASTGMVYSSSFDPRHAQHPRGSIDTLSTRSSGRAYDAQPISRKTYLDPSYGGATSKTEYSLRPRHNSVEGGSRRPLSLMVPSTAQESSRQRPIITSAGAHDRSRSPVPPKPYYAKEYPKEDRYLYPAVSSPRHHARQSSATLDDYTRRPDRDRRDRANSYISSSNGRGQPKAYHTLHAPAPVVRQSEPDDYSYTGPREQFDRDYPQPQPRPRRNSLTRAERPVSSADFGDWVPPNQSRRDPGPPVSSARHFERLGRSESNRVSTRPGASSDTERDSSVTRPRRNSRTRAPVSLHQERDEGYSSQRDDHGDRRDHRPRRERYEDDRYASDRERPHHRSHHERRNSVTRNGRTESRDRPSLSTGLAAAGLGATAAAGLVGLARDRTKDEEPSKDARREERERDKERRRREAEREAEEREREYRPEKPRERLVDSNDDPALRDPRRERVQRDRSDSDSQEGQEAKERRRRHRHEKERSHHDGESESGSDFRKDSSKHEQPERESEVDASGHRKHKHHHRHHRHDSHAAPEETTVRESPPAPVEEEYRPKKVTVVEPPKEKELDIKPKGILKQPKVSFPEDPNPTREGVAPLKDAGKKGIPPGARWTKINRLLVNPAALEEAHERFEERDDYVIVLRVLSKEEIQKYADKTKEIRETREREYLEKQRASAKAREGEAESDDLDESDEYTSDGDDNVSQDRRPPAPYHHQPPPQHQQENLAIEPPPTTQHQGVFNAVPGYQQNYVPGVDLGNGIPQQGQHQQPIMEHAQLPSQPVPGQQQQYQQYPPPPPPVPPQSMNGV